jgi:hypothetical protein
MLNLMQQRHRFTGDAFTAAGETELLGSGGFDVDLIHMAAEVFGDKDTHLRNMRQHFRRLSNDGDIHVSEGIAFGLNPPPGFAQQFATVGAFKGRVGIREQLANIPQRRRPQQGIGQCSATSPSEWANSPFS